MPNVRTCRRCGRIFNNRGSAVCDSCRKQEAQEAKRIKAYLAGNPGASPADVSSALNISPDHVQEYLKRRP